MVVRFFDIILSLIGLLVLLPIMIFIFLIGFFDTGSPLFFQTRMGRGGSPFTLIKFRTMHKNSASVATHLISASSVTNLGSFLRKSKLDELPQLLNVINGNMSLVGPRPNLFNQTELIEERKMRNVYEVRPGITGLAQLNDIDMSNPKLLAEVDARMIENMNLIFYFRSLIDTALGKGKGDRIKMKK